MQRARAFFNVSLGILALALAFHLGARSGQAQSLGVPVGAIFTSNPDQVACAVDGTGMLQAADYVQPELRGAIPVPRAGTIIACAVGALAVGQVRQAYVLYDNGDLYTFNADNGNSGWQLATNVFSSNGPIPVQRTTWGRIKADRR